MEFLEIKHDRFSAAERGAKAPKGGVPSQNIRIPPKKV
jgi:hypothetical protein